LAAPDLGEFQRQALFASRFSMRLFGRISIFAHLYFLGLMSCLWLASEEDGRSTQVARVAATVESIMAVALVFLSGVAIRRRFQLC
jgi:hypothetical protein